jgi:hypothetical protein
MSEPVSQMEIEVYSVAVGTQASQNNQNALAAPASQGLVVEKDVVDLDNSEDGGGKKEIASRSEMWDHSIKIRDDKKNC